MSEKGKRKEEDVEEGGGSDENADVHAPPKKAAKKSKEEGSEEPVGDNIVVCEISKKRRVTVRNWQGKVWVDIREFYEKDGKQLPGRKGISLNMDQWNLLKDHADKIDRAMAN